jgi:hypothetical protein
MKTPARMIAAAVAALLSGGLFPAQDKPAEFVLLKKIIVVSSTAWTDTGLDVQAGEEFRFEAAGTISLQKDNPVAACGPEGLPLRTKQQPLSEQNIGALLGKVREQVEVTEDKQTGEKATRDLGEAFFIGKENRVAMFASGRLLLGVNENVTADNDGTFEVSIYRRK